MAPAGAGETFALAAAVDAWRSAGVTVHGAALSARSAAELEASTGVASTTLARLVIDLETVRPGDVVIIGEFGMAPNRLVAPSSTKPPRRTPSSSLSATHANYPRSAPVA